MGIECKEGETIIDGEDISSLLEVLNSIPGIDIGEDSLKILLKEEQVSMCGSLCAENGCFAKRDGGLTTIGVLSSVEDAVIKSSGINN